MAFGSHRSIIFASVRIRCLHLPRAPSTTTQFSSSRRSPLVLLLPDVIDEEKGPFADCIDHVTALRVKLLNDLIEFEQKFTIEELEDDIREEQNADFMEGRAVHCFRELLDILEYVPEGYELDGDEDSSSNDENIEESFPDLDEEDEKIEEDETMKWDEDDDEEEEDEEGFDEDGDDDLGDEDEDEDDEDEEEDEKPSRRARKK